MSKVFTCVLDGKRFVGPVKYYAPDFKPCCSKLCADFLKVKYDIDKEIKSIDKTFKEKKIYIALTDYFEVLEKVESLFEKYKSGWCDDFVILLCNISSCYIAQKEYKSALKYSLKALEVLESHSCGYWAGLGSKLYSITYANLVYINKHLLNIDEAKKYVEKSIFSANNAYSQNSKYEKLPKTFFSL